MFAGDPNSKAFDITLMFCLIRSLTSYTRGIQMCGLPDASDVTPGADLVRIKFYRNELAHMKDNKICKSYLTTAWNNISNVS